MKNNEDKQKSNGDQSSGAVGYASFGKDVFDVVVSEVNKGTGDDTIIEFADLAVKHGLIQYIPYDRKLHGDEMAEQWGLDNGDMIYWWGK